MKLQFKLRCKRLYATTPALFTLTGFLLVGGAVITLASASMSGWFGFEASAASVPSLLFQDELQIKLSENGFTPTEVQRAAGTFAIAVENVALSGEYRLQLKAQDGRVVKEVHVQKGSAAWTVTLAAGEYTLTETNHPQWFCRIAVQ